MVGFLKGAPLFIVVLFLKSILKYNFVFQNFILTTKTKMLELAVVK